MLSSGELYNEFSNTRREEGDNMACKSMNCIKFCSEECKDTCKNCKYFSCKYCKSHCQGNEYELTVRDFIYQGKVKIMSTPRRELSIESEYPDLIGLEGRIAGISGNKIGIIVDNKYNKHSKFGWYWFEPECLIKIE